MLEDYLDIGESNINGADFRCESYEVGAILFSGGTTGIPKRLIIRICITSMVDRMEWGWPTGSNAV